MSYEKKCIQNWVFSLKSVEQKSMTKEGVIGLNGLNGVCPYKSGAATLTPHSCGEQTTVTFQVALVYNLENIYHYIFNYLLHIVYLL